MRRYGFWLAVALIATPAMAGPYLFELLQIKTYHASWNALLKGEKNVPAWIVAFGKNGDGVAGESTDIKVDGQDYVYATVCKPHDCGDNQLGVIFAAQGDGAWALLKDGDGERFFGKPDKAMSDALESQAGQ